jgi:hypothetical protein
MLRVVSRKGRVTEAVGAWRRRGRGAAAALALVVLLGQPASEAAPPAPAGSRSLHYDVSIHGFPLLAVDFRIAETAGSYSVSGAIRTVGVADWFAQFVMRSESDGTIAGDRLRPSLHETASHWRNHQRGTHLEYAADGSVAAAVTPAEEPGAPDPPLPTPEQTIGTLDPLSAILAINLAIARAGSCAMRVPVFDGRRRYDLVLADDGMERPAAMADAAPLRRCSIDLVKIAGFSEGEEAERNDRGRAWVLSQGEGQPAVPVRIEFDTRWGTIAVRMAPSNRPP